MDASQSQPLTTTQTVISRDHKKSSVNIWLVVALIVAVILMLVFLYLYMSNKNKANKGKASKAQ